MPVAQTPPVPTAVKFWQRSEKLWLPVWKDYAGNAISVSSGRPPIKPYFELFSVLVLHFEIFKAYTDTERKNEIDSLNSATWKGWNQYQAWISEVHTDGSDNIGGQVREQVHYVVRCIKRPDGWRFIHPDIGYIYDDGGNIKSFKSDDNLPYIGNLNGAGGDGGGTLTLNTEDVKQTMNFNSITGLS